ncbi:hypothetical protein EDC05_006536, partial [Coemansia umbellata]
EEWKTIDAQAAAEKARETLAVRAEFLQQLRAQYETAAQKAPNEDRPAASIFKLRMSSNRLADLG